MLIIQIIIILFVLFAIWRTAQKFKEKKLKTNLFLFWLIFWFIVGVVVALPQITSRLANVVGITRGADLVVYLSIIVLFYLIFRILVKLESLEQEITAVVRAVALKDEHKKQ